eukprot:6212871-Pleurochrysis_carterae.AAC.5
MDGLLPFESECHISGSGPRTVKKISQTCICATNLLRCMSKEHTCHQLTKKGTSIGAARVQLQTYRSRTLRHEHIAGSRGVLVDAHARETFIPFRRSSHLLPSTLCTHLQPIQLSSSLRQQDDACLFLTIVA